MATLLDAPLLAQTLQALPGWSGDTHALMREVHLTPAQDAELRERVAIDTAALAHPVTVETVSGGTRYVLTSPAEGGVTELDIMLASHISDLAHRLDEREPGVHARRADAIAP